MAANKKPRKKYSPMELRLVGTRLAYVEPVKNEPKIAFGDHAPVPLTMAQTYYLMIVPALAMVDLMKGIAESGQVAAIYHRIKAGQVIAKLNYTEQTQEYFNEGVKCAEEMLKLTSDVANGGNTLELEKKSILSECIIAMDKIHLETTRETMIFAYKRAQACLLRLVK